MNFEIEHEQARLLMTCVSRRIDELEAVSVSGQELESLYELLARILGVLA